MTSYYAGIGARRTPTHVLHEMEAIAADLCRAGLILRSGGADGADSAFERGAMHRKEIFLPWQGFNGSLSPLFHMTDAAMALARTHHPAWDKCSRAARLFHARNCFQVLGRDLDSPVDFVVCWTPDGKATGGTGQALRIAQAYDIAVYNLQSGPGPEVLPSGPESGDFAQHYAQGGVIEDDDSIPF